MACFQRYPDAPKSSKSEEQELRSMLRKRFLRSLMHNSDKPALFRMYERTTVTGDFVACDFTPSQVHVANLQTPSGLQRQALLRTSDMVAFTVKLERPR